MKKRIAYIIMMVLAIVLLPMFFMGINYKILDRGTIVKAPKVTSIPFRLSTDGHILIDITLDQTGKKYAFLLDTGASNFIYQELPKNITGNTIGIGISRDINGKLNFPKVKNIPFIAFGGIQLKDVSFKKMEHKFTCYDDVYGIIGKNVMRHFAWYFDMEHMIIHVAKSSTDLPKIANEGTKIGIKTNSWSHHIKIPVRYQDTINDKLLLDTGQAGGFTFSDVMAKSISDKTIVPILGEGARGVGGASKSFQYYTSVKQLQIGAGNKLTINNVVARVTEKSSFKAIGMDFLRNFNFTLDWQNELIILNPPTAINNVSATGFGVRLDYREGGTFIRSVLEGSKAELLGIRPNMEISAVNNTIIANQSDFCRIKNSIKSADTLHITLKKTDKAVVLEKFDYKDLF